MYKVLCDEKVMKFRRFEELVQELELANNQKPQLEFIEKLLLLIDSQDVVIGNHLWKLDSKGYWFLLEVHQDLVRRFYQLEQMLLDKTINRFAVAKLMKKVKQQSDYFRIQ